MEHKKTMIDFTCFDVMAQQTPFHDNMLTP
jgi:hypothetical protein